MTQSRNQRQKYYSDHGYPTLLQVLPDAIERNTVREALELHKEALVSFIVSKPNHSHHLTSIGSGFFLISDLPAYALIVTAKHVIEDFEIHGFGFIRFGSKLIPIDDIGIRKLNTSQDIGYWYIPLKYLQDFAVPGIFALPTWSEGEIENHFDPTCSFAIFGYPSSKNDKLDTIDNADRDRKIFGLALHGYNYDVKSRELCFNFNGKGTPESWAAKITTPPRLDGMSGCPCLRFVISREFKRLALVVAGVFSRKYGANEIRAAILNESWLNEH